MYLQMHEMNVSLFYTTVNLMNASSVPGQEAILSSGCCRQEGIVIFCTKSISGIEYSRHEDTLPLSWELSVNSFIDILKGTNHPGRTTEEK